MSEEPTTARVHIVQADGWMAVYLDDKKVHEDHDIRPAKLLELLGIEHDETWAQDQVDAERGFPAAYSEVRPDL